MNIRCRLAALERARPGDTAFPRIVNVDDAGTVVQTMGGDEWLGNPLTELQIRRTL